MIHSCPHCSKPIEVKNGGKTVSEPGKTVNAHRALGDSLFKEVLKLHGRQAIGAAHRRYGRAVRDILAAAGSAEKGLLAAKEIVAHLERQQLSWTLETVAKHIFGWLTSRDKYQPPQTFGVKPKRQSICIDSDCRTPVQHDGDYCRSCADARKPLTEK